MDLTLLWGLFHSKLDQKILNLVFGILESSKFPDIYGLEAYGQFRENKEHGIYHGLETIVAAKNLLELGTEDLPQEVRDGIYLGAFFHDCGYFSGNPQMNYSDHHIRSEIILRQLLEVLSYPKLTVNTALEAVLCHRGKDPAFPPPESYSAKVVCDADSLSELNIPRLVKIDPSRKFITGARNEELYLDRLILSIFHHNQSDLLKINGGDVLLHLLYNFFIWTNPNNYYLDESKSYLRIHDCTKKTFYELVGKIKEINILEEKNNALEAFKKLFWRFSRLPGFDHLEGLSWETID